MIPREEGIAKIFAFIARRRDISAGEFHALWRHPHGTLASDIDTFLRYVQAHRIEGLELAGLSSPHDGAAEMWFRSLDDALSLGANDYYRSAVIPDEVRFMDLGPRCFRLLTTQQIVTEPPRSALERGAKLLHCVRRPVSVTLEDFRRRLSVEGERALGKRLGVTGHVLSWSMDETYGDRFVPFDGSAHQWLTPDPYDVVRELWWPNVHELKGAVVNNGEAWEELLGGPLIDASRSDGWVADELVVVG